MSTSPRVTFGLYNLEISSGSNPSATDIQAFSKPSDLKTGNVSPRPIATYEPDYWILDGQYKFVSDIQESVHVGLVSLSMSDGSGVFAVPPVLTVDFDRVYSSDGLVVQFSRYSNDYATSIKVEYFDSENNLISSDTYTPSSYEFSVDKSVSGFKKIVITFFSTNKGQRYLRVSGVDYGKLISFDGTAIKRASVVEEIDVLGASVPANSFELSLYSNDSSFSIVNPSGYYARLSQRQPLSVYEIVNQNPVFLGKYYLDTWENASKTEIKFTCIDAIGVLDRVPFRGGLYPYIGIKLQYLVNLIMETASIPFELDTSLYDIRVMGWIPYGTCREALQQVALAVGAYIDCSRSNVVKIRKSQIVTGAEEALPITKAEKGSSAPLKMRSLVTGVEVISHNYTAGNETKQLFSGILPSGKHEIVFKEPSHSLEISGAVILDSGVNYATIMVNKEGNVILSGKNYIDNQRLFSKQGEFGAFVIPNVLKIEQATLVNTYNGQAVVDRIYSYYQQRYIQKVRLFAPVVEVGSVTVVDSIDGSKVRGVVEKMSANLTGGFVTDTEIVGVIDGVD